MPSKGRRFILHLCGAFLVGLVLMAIPTFLVEKNAVEPISDFGGVTIGFIQLAALYFPALAIFTQLLLEFSYRKGDMAGKAGGVGFYRPEVFRWGVIFAAGFSSLLLIIGIVTLVFALNIPPTIESGAALIMSGMILGPLMLVYVALLEFREI